MMSHNSVRGAMQLVKKEVWRSCWMDYIYENMPIYSFKYNLNMLLIEVLIDVWDWIV